MTKVIYFVTPETLAKLATKGAEFLPNDILKFFAFGVLCFSYVKCLFQVRYLKSEFFKILLYILLPSIFNLLIKKLNF